MGKARLAPIKVMTIPRLELTAATVSIRLGEVLKKELDDTPDVVKYHRLYYGAALHHERPEAFSSFRSKSCSNHS